jgi:hypothetical protein
MEEVKAYCTQHWNRTTEKCLSVADGKCVSGIVRYTSVRIGGGRCFTEAGHKIAPFLLIP